MNDIEKEYYRRTSGMGNTGYESHEMRRNIVTKNKGEDEEK